ncbi:MAG: class B sortase [bacterium]|nr:class B sortase [bacterium]MCM1561680.1 class B sortase [Butyrivibrio sp.]
MLFTRQQIISEAPGDGREEPTVPSEYGEAEDAREWPEVDFTVLQEINPDLVGWIYIEGTEISYPVMQGEDNIYYLDHLFTGEKNKAGCIFLDSRNQADFSDRNSIVYGHYLKNGTMFTGISQYKKQEYYDAHSIILFLTPEGNFEIEVFAGYVAGMEDEAWEIAFLSDSDYRAWLSEVRGRSCFSSSIVPAVTDRVLTLSTCSYESDNARFVFLGRFVER